MIKKRKSAIESKRQIECQRSEILESFVEDDLLVLAVYFFLFVPSVLTTSRPFQMHDGRDDEKRQRIVLVCLCLPVCVMSETERV